MKRRNFFKKTIIATTVVFSAGSLIYYFKFDDSGELVLNPFIQDFLSDKDLSMIIEEYLREEKDAEEISFSLDSLVLVRQRIREDFYRGNTNIYNGWVLSKSEMQFLIQETITEQ